MEQNSMDIAQGTGDNRKKKRIIAIIVGVIMIIALVIGFFIYNNMITAVTMRIQRLVGTVNLYNESGAEQSLREKMRLGAGQTVTTAGESLIMVSLDDTKLMTMEESSRAEIKAHGKKLLFNLLEGNLFFNVTEKLSDDEAFDIQTSTMICGIRGTSAYVGRDVTSHEILMVTDGDVEVDATNPVTLEQIHEIVHAGERITIFLDDEAEGDRTISIRKDKFREEDLPALALDAIHKDRDLQEKISKATGFSLKKLDELTKVCTREGVSMFGSAADQLAASGINDSIPFMGKPAWAIVDTANGAADIAGEDLPLEIAIIKGAYDAANGSRTAGYDSNGIYEVAAAAGRSACLAVGRAKAAGLASARLVTVAASVNGATSRSIGKMASSRLSAGEVAHVVDTIGIVYQIRIDEAAATGDQANIEAAVKSSEEHVDKVVTAEMERSSDGDTTSDALLAGSGRNVGSSGDEQIPEKKEEELQDADEEKKQDGDGAGDTGSGSTAASGNASSTGNTKSGDYTPTSDTTKPGFAVKTGAASQTELKNAHDAIVFTEPNTRVVALGDGTLFDPTYYAVTNPDVVSAYGTSTDALLAHWLKQGRSQGRPPIAPKTPEPKPEWLLRQEAEERRMIAEAPDDDDDDSSSSSPSPATNVVDSNGNFRLPGGVTGNIIGNGMVTLNTTSKGSVTVPLNLKDENGGNVNYNSPINVGNVSHVDWLNSGDGSATDGTRTITRNGDNVSVNDPNLPVGGNYDLSIATDVTAFENYLNTL